MQECQHQMIICFEFNFVWHYVGQIIRPSWLCILIREFHVYVLAYT